MTDTLRSICEQCPHLRDPQLDFISPELQRHKEIIRRDLGELVVAASYGLDKSVVALAGSVLEGLLFCFLKSQEFIISMRRNERFFVDPDKGLEDYVNAFRRFRRYFAFEFSPDILPQNAISYRNLIHINREIGSGRDFCRNAAPDMLRILDAVLGELETAPG